MTDPVVRSLEQERLFVVNIPLGWKVVIQAHDPERTSLALTPLVPRSKRRGPSVTVEAVLPQLPIGFWEATVPRERAARLRKLRGRFASIIDWVGRLLLRFAESADSRRHLLDVRGDDPPRAPPPPDNDTHIPRFQ